MPPVLKQLRLRPRPATHHLTCAVEFALVGGSRWPQAVVTILPSEDWLESTPPEALLFPRMLQRLTAAPDAYDRFYGRLVAAALMELLDHLTAQALTSEEVAQRPTKGYGMTVEVLSPRADERAEKAGAVLLKSIPERVRQLDRPAYARVVANLQTKRKLGLHLELPSHEPEHRKHRAHPERSLILGSAAFIALVEQLSESQDYASIVVPTMTAVRGQVVDWQGTHDERGNPLAAKRSG